MPRIVASAFSLLFVVTTVYTVEAKEPHQEWMQNLKGEWTYEWVELGLKGESTSNIGAKRQALITRGKEGDGNTSVGILGWRSDSKTLVGTGFGSAGNYWHTEFTEITGESMSGKVHGVLPDGRVFEGTITRKRVDDDHQEAFFKGTADGEELRITGKFARKK